jgi:hypothetical protein
MNPYTDISPEVRQFSEKVDEIDLKWHRDLEDRTVVSIEETDWKIQLENELPISLNSPVFIKAGIWHRVIKGNSELKIKIIRRYENKAK